jgi:hypothetical protein
VPIDTLRRVTDLTRPHGPRLNETNQFIYHHIRRRADHVGRPETRWPADTHQAAA